MDQPTICTFDKVYILHCVLHFPFVPGPSDSFIEGLCDFHIGYSDPDLDPDLDPDSDLGSDPDQNQDPDPDQDPALDQDPDPILDHPNLMILL